MGTFRISGMIHLISRIPIPVGPARAVCGQKVVAELLDQCPDIAVFDLPYSAVLAPQGFEPDVDEPMARLRTEVTAVRGAATCRPDEIPLKPQRKT